MGTFRAFYLRMRGVFVRRKAVEFDAELESHIAMDADHAMRSGLNSEEARRQALLRLGGAEQTRQAYRDRRKEKVRKLDTEHGFVKQVTRTDKHSYF